MSTPTHMAAPSAAPPGPAWPGPARVTTRAAAARQVAGSGAVTPRPCSARWPATSEAERPRRFSAPCAIRSPRWGCACPPRRCTDWPPTSPRGAPSSCPNTAGPDQRIAWGPECRVAAHTGSEPIGRTAVDGPVDAATCSTTRSSGMPTACAEHVWTRARGGWCPPPTGSGYRPSTCDPGARRRRRPERPADGATIRAGDHTSLAHPAEPRR